MSTPSNGTFTDETLHLADGSRVALRLYGGAAAQQAGARVLHFHGGAFVGGTLASGAAVAGVLAEHAAVVASLDYPLAPAHPFPQAVEAGYLALQWLANKAQPKGHRQNHRQNRRALQAAAPLFVAGEEAGGNIAAAVALMARDRGGPQLAGQVLLSPMLDTCVATASQRAAHDGPLGCPCADGWRAYLAQASDALHPYASPGTSWRLAGLPPTLLLSSVDDPLRDETLAYARRLHEAGVVVQATVLPVATGWPASYARGAPAPWTAALHGHLRPWLSPASPNPLPPLLCEGDRP